MKLKNWQGWNETLSNVYLSSSTFAFSTSSKEDPHPTWEKWYHRSKWETRLKHRTKKKLNGKQTTRHATTSKWVQDRQIYEKPCVGDTGGEWVQMVKVSAPLKVVCVISVLKVFETWVNWSFQLNSPHSCCFPSSLGGKIFSGRAHIKCSFPPL